MEYERISTVDVDALPWSIDTVWQSRIADRWARQVVSDEAGSSAPITELVRLAIEEVSAAGEVRRRILTLLDLVSVRPVDGAPAPDGLLVLPDHGQLLLPTFQLDADDRPRDGVGTVNLTLRSDSDPWGAASWWLKPQAMLSGRTPLDALADSPPATLADLAMAEFDFTM